ncbi:hypothetical protein J3458_009170 [Metarhizium acridum]|nr:hypothetical protein J3458_009170 [Metarhizium acridum]
MARPENRERQRTHGCLRENASLKKVKFSRKRNFSPAFWDNLSKVSLTPRALRELDRRNSTHPFPTIVPTEAYATDIARFARRGGPDLRYLRRYPFPKPIEAMSSSLSSTSRSRRTRSTAATSVGSKTRKSSAYNDDFEQHLVDHGIYPEGYEHPESCSTPEPANSSLTHQELLNSRASLSPSVFTESVFRDFKRKNKTKSEGSVMRNVIPMIAGSTNIANEGDMPFTNLLSLTDDSTVKVVPDFFDGARASEVHGKVRHTLNELIVPTKHANVPIAPNFFLEAKGPDGGASVAQRQACYDGAHGARAMHALQNYQETEPIFDGNAYTYSSTYHSGTGTLQLYAHHVTAPAAVNERPEYHMTEIDGWQMTGNINSFRRGAIAFRNARDLAQRHRNSFIQAANARATQAMPVVQEDVAETHEGLDDSPTPHDSRDDPAYMTRQDADDTLQQQLAFEDETEAISTYVDEGSPNSGQELEPPTLSKAPTQKRSRHSTSPPSSSKRTLSSQG